MSGAEQSRRKALDAFRHEAYGAVGSTNEECLERARKGEAGGLWITATRQTGGRGRRGRAWVSEPGNLYASLLLTNIDDMTALASLPLAVAVAVYEAVSRVLPAGGDALEIKWPNDVLIGRAKCCGILLEAERDHHGGLAVVIGIGLNIAHKPESGLYKTTCLQDHGVHQSAEEIFAHLFETIAEKLALWDCGRGIAEITRQWRNRACGLGEQITVNLPDRSIKGVFAGIDERGMLLLDQGSLGISSIAAGDVFFEPSGPLNDE